jgi:hypothetical protein
MFLFLRILLVATSPLFTQRYMPRLSGFDAYVAPSLPIIVLPWQSIAE